MAKYKIEYDENTCVGTLNCVAEAAKYFAEDDEGYTVLSDSSLNEKTGKHELIIDDSGIEMANLAESGCPVSAITVTKIED